MIFSLLNKSWAFFPSCFQENFQRQAFAEKGYGRCYNEADMETQLNGAEQELAQKHPIVYDSFNLCKLASQKRLNKFSIPVLNSICFFFVFSFENLCVLLCEECECQW